MQALLAQTGGQIDAVAYDLHPDFFSTDLALRLAQQHQVPAIAVQHHHAHIAAVLAERGLHQPVLGLALDGVGLGTDGTAWGGELLRGDGAQLQRLGHLLPLALPGGDVVAQNLAPAAAAVHACGLTAQIEPRLSPVVGTQAARTVQTMLQGLNCPELLPPGAGLMPPPAAGPRRCARPWKPKPPSPWSRPPHVTCKASSPMSAPVTGP